ILHQHGEWDSQSGAVNTAEILIDFFILALTFGHYIHIMVCVCMLTGALVLTHGSSQILHGWSIHISDAILLVNIRKGLGSLVRKFEDLSKHRQAAQEIHEWYL